MRQKSIKKNMIMNIILTMSNFLFPLITFGYVSRVLGPSGIGKVSFVHSIISYFIYLSALGIPAYGLREAAKVRDNKDKLSKLVQELLIINFFSTIISYFLLFLSVIFISKLSNYKILFFIMSTSILLNSIGLEWLYNSLEEYTYIAVRSIIFKIIYVILTFILIKTENDYLWYGFLTIFVSSANYICNFYNSRKYINYKKYPNYNFKNHFKPIFYLFSASILITIYSNFDISMLGFLKSENEVGLYNTALKIKGIVLSLSTAITSVIIPRIAYYSNKKNKEKIKSISLFSMRTSLILAFPISIYTFLYPKNILMFLCGERYLGASLTLQILALCIIVLILTNLFGNQLLIPLGKEKRFSQSVFIGLFINIFLNFLLIPKYGCFGAAIGTLITELWNVFWMSTGVLEYLKYLIKNINLKIYIISISFACFFSYIIYINILSFNNLSILLMTSFTFFLVYYLLLIIFQETLLVNELRKIKDKCKLYR